MGSIGELSSIPAICSYVSLEQDRALLTSGASAWSLSLEGLRPLASGDSKPCVCHACVVGVSLVSASSGCETLTWWRPHPGELAMDLETACNGPVWALASSGDLCPLGHLACEPRHREAPRCMASASPCGRAPCDKRWGTEHLNGQRLR